MNRKDGSRLGRQTPQAQGLNIAKVSTVRGIGISFLGLISASRS